MKKRDLIEAIRSCGGEANYSGKTKTMYVHHLKDVWTFNVLTAYLFGKFKLVFQE